MPTSSRIHPDFTALPWCCTILNDPTYSHLPNATFTARPNQEPDFNTLMGRTLATPSTIRAIQYLYKPAGSLSPSSGSNSGSEMLALISLGGALTSHASTLHGGINTVLVDEVAGALAMHEVAKGTSMMAVNLNVNLRRSVKTPGVVVVGAWKEREAVGRKNWVRAMIEQDGVRCIDAECLYLTVDSKPSKL